MSVKQEAKQRFFSQNKEQLELAESLDEGFDITFGTQHGGLFFWLCNPKPIISERFGLQKEIIALYSPHQNTDARTLTNLENISSHPDFRHRVDKIIAIIIHEGNKEKTTEWLKQTTDWIIIPIHANELRNKDRGSLFLRSKLAERVGTFDLFGMSSPIKHDKYFYGRDPLVQEIRQRIAVRKENSGIFGLRKTGKTSVLFAIQRRLPDNIIAEYIDCHSPGIYGSRWWQLLSEISERFCSKVLETCDIKVSDDGIYDRVNASNSFNRIIKKILRATHKASLCLLFDEIEFITPGISNALGQHWDEDFVLFWQTIRSVSQEVEGCLTFVVAGVNPSSVEKSHFNKIQNPIFQLAIPYYLEALNKHDVRDMVRTIGRYSGLLFNEDCYEYLKDTYGGHPYLIRLACSEVSKTIGQIPVESKISVDINKFSSLRLEIKSRLSLPIKDILLSLVWWYPDDYELLLILADGDTEFVLSFLESTPEKATQFVRYGLVHANNGIFAIKDLKDFLNDFGSSYKDSISPFKRGDLPLEALPEQVNLDDLAVLFEKRTEVEVALRKYILLVFGYKTGFNDQSISEMISKALIINAKDHGKKSQLFVGRRPQTAINELMLSDLKPIYKNHWDDFSPVFDKNKTRFEMNMDTINIARRYDAHAKPVLSIDRDNFINSYNWFISRLSKVPNLLSD